ncbi:MAG TPA: hypothetical protein VM914_11455 [Pyrinomonadaceae bacterium]|jgi:hypothetical protein|nr:hypothetical protein [Pyrinomonadaceae bacterium]
MGYYLQAVIGRASLDGDLRLPSARVITLRQGLRMIPLTDALFEEIQASLPDGGEPLERFEKFSPAVARWVQELSTRGLAAYVEAEYFGGTGGQAAVVWRHGETVFGPVHSDDAINRALRVFGVEAGGGLDEFDAVGLGLRRSTDDWLEGPPL